jgi:hypothetical protein
VTTPAEKGLWSTRRFELPLTLCFFFVVFLLFFHPIKWGDFWAHLSMGKWIVENGQLPPGAEDPISHSATSGDTARRAVVVKGYWLSQAIYYLLYTAGGFWAHVVTNAAFFTVMAMLLYLALRQGRLNLPSSLAVLMPVVFLIRSYDEVRPQNLSFFFALLLFLLLERGLKQVEERPGRIPKSFLCVPPLMLVWANMHQGVIIGHLVLFAYVAAEGFSSFRDHNRSGTLKTMCILAVASFLASLVNPSGIILVLVSLKELAQWSEFQGLRDQLSPWEYSEIPGKAYFASTLVVLMLLTVTPLIVSWRSIRLRHALLFLVFLAGALKTYRLGPFFMLLGPAIASRYAGPLVSRMGRRVHAGSLILLALVLSYLLVSFARSDVLRHGPIYHEYLPVQAARFIKEARLEDNLYNPYNWGGYLSWVLGPERKVFLTSTIVDTSAYQDARSISTGLQNDLLDAHGVRTVILSPVNRLDGRVSGLAISLLKNSRWRLVYMDKNASLFVREGTSPHMPSRDKQEHWKALLDYAKDRVAHSPDDEEGYYELAGIYLAMGKWDKAQETLREAEGRKK